jgi:hypothetical protein
MKTNIYFWSYLGQFFVAWEMSQTKFVEGIKKHIVLGKIIIQLDATMKFIVSWIIILPSFTMHGHMNVKYTFYFQPLFYKKIVPFTR